jgi:hypothetical protein
VAFGDVLIDEFHQAELVGEVVESGQAPEGGNAGPQRRGGGGLEALEQGIGRAEVGEDDGAGAAVQAAGLDELVVGVPWIILCWRLAMILVYTQFLVAVKRENRNRLGSPRSAQKCWIL